MTSIFRLHGSHDASSIVTSLRSVAPTQWFSGAAEVVVACLFVTCTFVTVTRPIFDNGACQLMLPLFAVAALVLEALCIVRDVRGIPAPCEWSRSLTLITCSFFAMLAWAAVSIPFHDHVIYDYSMGITRGLPLYALVMPLAEATVTLLVAVFACRLIAVSNVEGALWRLSMLMAIVNPIDLVREYAEGNTTGWRVSTKLGGAAIGHVVVLLALAVAVDAAMRNRHRIASSMAAVSHLACIAVSGSRAGIISVALFVVGVVLFRRSRRTRKQWAITAASTIVASGVAIWIVSRARTGSLVDPARARTWALAGRVMMDSPNHFLLGTGYGMIWPWFAVESTFMPESSHGLRLTHYGYTLPHAHNLIIQVAGELGVVGLVFLFVCLGTVIAVCVKGIRGGYTVVSLGVLATMVAFLMDTYLIKNFPVALFWWFFTLALCRLVTAGDVTVAANSGHREDQPTE
ncbi:O-antigen ligase family protein [Cutibacterium sp. WCA-380-WT-3A]|uniref:O-antigen ligase family protein n=1 Tax=Cutibacterium porci TaxID=2605781 RepID=A0A7K0J4C4_9ACTN|nr:O-antigen ligase family protein [Cutibacterium porci]MSS44790.1 O-antigen ligase family protein [Cutibacterium porci]